MGDIIDRKRRVNEIVRWVGSFDCMGDERAHVVQVQVLNLLETSPDPYDRTDCEPGHITASAIVWCPGSEQFLFVFHRRLGRWLQPGGHVEPTDVDPWHAARREAEEETGVDLAPETERVLIGMDIHDIPPGPHEPAHQHFDLAFFFRARGRRLRMSLDRSESVWCGLADFNDYGVDQSIRRHVERATRHIRLSGAATACPPRREGHEHGSSRSVH